MRKFNIEQITCNAHFIEQDLTYNTHFSLHIVYNSNLHNQCIRRESSFFLVTITSFSASLYSNRNGAIFSKS